MSSEKRESSRTAATPTAPGWYRVAGHPAGIVVFAAASVRRSAPRPSFPVSRHLPRSKHA